MSELISRNDPFKTNATGLKRMTVAMIFGISLIATVARTKTLPTKQHLKSIKRNLVVAILSWLLMNTDPAYAQRAIKSMIASRLLQRTVAQMSPFNALKTHSSSDTHNGLNAVEAIALIHAMNGHRNSGGGQLDMSQLLRADHGGGTGSGGAASNSRSQSGQLAMRQADLVPLNPLQRQALAPATVAAAVAAAAAAFLAAVVAGLAPLAALAAAFVAAAAALLAALVAVLALVPVPMANKAAPLVKKLVIKKTVLPFVIPIPIKKKEVVYIPQPVHYKEHHHHVEHKQKQKHKHKYKKHKKSDDLEDLSYEPPAMSRSLDPDQSSKIHSVISEQDRIQDIVDNLVESTQMTGAASTSSAKKIKRH